MIQLTIQGNYGLEQFGDGGVVVTLVDPVTGIQVLIPFDKDGFDNFVNQCDRMRARNSIVVPQAELPGLIER